MPVVTFSIDPMLGAVAPVALSISGPRYKAMVAANQKPPPPIPTRGLIDTGASCTTVSPRIVRELGLTPTGTTWIRTPSTGATPHACNQYDVTVILLLQPPEIHVASVILPVIETDFEEQGFEILIGRDVLSKGIVIYNGPDLTVSLAF